MEWLLRCIAYMKPLEIIINHPEQIAPLRRTLYGIFTLVVWYVWLNLWLPLVTFIAWVVGGVLGYHQMVELANYRQLLHMFACYGLVIAVLAGGLLIWATYNLLRFRGKERRARMPDVSVQTYADLLGITPAQYVQRRHARVMVVHHRMDGSLESADVRMEGFASAA